jgi:hypothetical protein
MTPVKLRAQRANARLSRGPRTPEGRRRSALNHRGMGLARTFNRPGETQELLRIWRDLLAQFWFMKPELWRARPLLELHLERAALLWWGKLDLVRKGLRGENLWAKNKEIEERLSDFLFQLRMGNQKCGYWLRKQFGTDGGLDIPALRESIEARLGLFGPFFGEPPGATGDERRVRSPAASKR